jgi:hypothetical protein
VTITTIPWIVVLAFGAFFIFAAVREIMHRRKYGPPENPRDVFEFDEDAPSYQEPEALPDETVEDSVMEAADDETADADETDSTDATTPDRNETPR